MFGIALERFADARGIPERDDPAFADWFRGVYGPATAVPGAPGGDATIGVLPGDLGAERRDRAAPARGRRRQLAPARCSAVVPFERIAPSRSKPATRTTNRFDYGEPEGVADE